MNVTELFKDSLTYPTKDWNKLTILGALMIIIVVLAILTVFSVFTGNFLLVAIFSLITIISSLIIGLIYSGYGLRVTKETIENRQMSDNIHAFPDFNVGENLIDGFKVLVLEIVYMIIPILITVILAYALGLFNPVIITQYVDTVNGSLSNPYALESFKLLSSEFMIVQSVYYILTVIFTLFMLIAKARLAETSKLSSIFEIKEIVDTIDKIGWGNYIIWYILLMVISFIIMFILGIIMLIPIIGIIIGLLLIIPFMIIFESRALGLIYNEAK